MTPSLLFLHVLSPLHAGTGQGVGAIDLPIAREKSTGIPYLPGSSIKGVLRDLWTKGDETQRAIFGPDTSDADAHAGAAQFADAHLLCMPVRSLAGTFAWVTSPYLLKRYQRDIEGSALSAGFAIHEPETDKCFVSGTELEIDTKVYIEDLDLDIVALDVTSQEYINVKSWAKHIAEQVFTDPTWQKEFIERFCIVSDNTMNFLLETATEVVTRITLDDDKKTVKDGQLWYEESLPTESILVGLLLTNDSKYDKKSELNAAAITKAIGEKIHNKTIQFGGKANVGRGLCRVTLKGA
jgi:CRISPR-associated protein Cmr4